MEPIFQSCRGSEEAVYTLKRAGSWVLGRRAWRTGSSCAGRQVLARSQSKE